jgi:DNA-binding LytR/AlgR family response regulator
MSKMKVVIIEDEFFAAKHLKAMIEEKGFFCAGIYRSGEHFLNETDWEFDVAMVDIFLSTDLTGLDVAKEIKAKNKPFFFLTANKDEKTLRSAARLAPKTYITKPFNPNDVIAALKTIEYQLPKLIEVQDTQGKRSINPSDIVYLKSDHNYIEIQTLSKKIVLRKSLTEIAEDLPDFFIRVHRSYIINCHLIDYQNTMIVTVNGHKIPVSRKYKDSLKDQI